MTPPAPTVEEMVAWCEREAVSEGGGNASESVFIMAEDGSLKGEGRSLFAMARNHRARMLSAIAARLRQGEGR